MSCMNDKSQLGQWEKSLGKVPGALMLRLRALPHLPKRAVSSAS